MFTLLGRVEIFIIINIIIKNIIINIILIRILLPVPFSTAVNDASRARRQVMSDLFAGQHQGTAVVLVDALNAFLRAQRRVFLLLAPMVTTLAASGAIHKVAACHVVWPYFARPPHACHAVFVVKG